MKRRLAKPWIAEPFGVVGETDEGTSEPGHPQVVQMERLPYGPAKGKERDQEDGADGG